MIDGVKIVAKNGTGIDVWDPYVLLGVAKPSYGYDIGYICSNAHGKTKMFSFHKPYNINQNEDLTDAQIRAINCGLTFPVKGNITDIPGCFDGSANGWAYTPPSAPYALRIDDFIGYTNNPTPLVGQFIVPTTAYKNASVHISAAISQDEDSVKLSDLQKPGENLSDWYFGVLIVPTNGSGNSYVATASTKLSATGAADVSFAGSGFDTSVSKSYNVYPLLSAQAISFCTVGSLTSTLNKFVPLPLASAQTMTVQINTNRVSLNNVRYEAPVLYFEWVVTSAYGNQTFSKPVLVITHPDNNASGSGSYTAKGNDLTYSLASITTDSDGKASGSGSYTMPANFQQALSSPQFANKVKAYLEIAANVYAWSPVAIWQDVE